MFHRITALAKKELLAIWKDKRSRFVLVGPPIIQLLIFGYAATFDLSHIPLAVFNEDEAAPSRELIAKFTGSPSFEHVATLHHDKQIADLIDNQAVLMVVHIGPQFSRTLYSGESANVQVIIDGRNSNTAMVALNDIRAIVTEFNEQWSQTRAGTGPPANLVIRAWYNANLESRWFFVPGIVALLTLVVTMVVTALSIAREREAGTFDQLLVTPLRPVDILLGKALPGFLIGTVEATFIITVAVLWFDIPLRGSIMALYAGIFVFLLSAIGIGLMISSLAVTQQQGLLGAFLFVVPAVVLSGFATPIANMPEIVQYLTYLNPMRYFLVILRGVFLEGASFSLLWSQYWPMLLIGMTTLTFASWLFRRRMY